MLIIPLFRTLHRAGAMADASPLDVLHKVPAHPHSSGAAVGVLQGHLARRGLLRYRLNWHKAARLGKRTGAEAGTVMSEASRKLLLKRRAGLEAAKDLLDGAWDSSHVHEELLKPGLMATRLRAALWSQAAAAHASSSARSPRHRVSLKRWKI